MFSYLYPPRPAKAIPRDLIITYENMGWIAQIKKNGTCNVIAVKPGKEFIVKNRHAGNHKAWSPTEHSQRAFHALPGKGWYVFAAELMNNKVKDLRDTNYIFDIMVADGQYLLMSEFSERQELLKKLFLKGTSNEIHKLETKSHYCIDPNLWLAKTFRRHFIELFDTLGWPEDEGLVFKNPKASLEICSKETSNTSWQVKCRHGHKNFSF